MTWEVTLLNRGVELTLRVEAGSKEGARRESRRVYPIGHIIHVQPVPATATVSVASEK